MSDSTPAFNAEGSNEVVERVAKRIYDTMPGPDGTGVFMAEPWRSCIDAAIAAIEAMREPTEVMIKAGADADIPGGRWGEPTFRESSVDGKDVPVIWQAMIDAALIGGPPSTDDDQKP